MLRKFKARNLSGKRSRLKCSVRPETNRDQPRSNLQAGNAVYFRIGLRMEHSIILIHECHRLMTLSETLSQRGISGKALGLSW